MGGLIQKGVFMGSRFYILLLAFVVAFAAVGAVTAQSQNEGGAGASKPPKGHRAKIKSVHLHRQDGFHNFDLRRKGDGHAGHSHSAGGAERGSSRSAAGAPAEDARSQSASSEDRRKWFVGAGRRALRRSPFASNQDAPQLIREFLNERRTQLKHGSEAIDRAKVVRDYVSRHNGLRTLVYQQQVAGIPVFEGLLKAHVTGSGELVNVANQFHASAESLVNRAYAARVANLTAPVISAEQAVYLSAANLGAKMSPGSLVQSSFQVETGRNFFRGPAMNGDAAVWKVWLPLESDELKLCWQVEFTVKALEEMFRCIVDAETGKVWVRHSLTVDASPATYRVYTSDSPTPFSPGFASPTNAQPPAVARQLVTITSLSSLGSPNGWINDGVNETRGNNVDAHLDLDNDDLPDLPRPQGNARKFDFPLDLTKAPSTYRNAAVTQLFYWNNWVHDKLYDLGFTEAAGNFQENNFGRGGLELDAVQADAQDGGGTDNANFSTPSDGLPPRMQMYIFSGPNPDRDGDLDAEVIIHEYVHGLSNRLVGGGIGISELQSMGLGEGWSDFYALALLSEPADNVDGNYALGAYVFKNYYSGIRRYPYTTNMGKNPLTLKDIEQHSEVHDQGEVWCVTLWEARANLIKKHGFAVGNQLILQLVTDGLKLTPANPTFLEARDAILQADQINNAGANLNELWKAFAKRGLGASAVVPASDSTSGVSEAFDLPNNLSIAPGVGKTFRGPAGGGFYPDSGSFTLRNLGDVNLNWSATKSATWFNLLNTGGWIASGASTTLNYSLNSSAYALPAGVYTNIITFVNHNDAGTQQRRFILRVGQQDHLAESFESADFDLDNMTLTFKPDGSTSFYRLCCAPATVFPVDPSGGTPLTLADDGFQTISITGGKKVFLYGVGYNSVHVGSNGFLTFLSGDIEYFESFEHHFAAPRISALFNDLNPTAGGTVTYKQLADRWVVTYQNIPEYGVANSNNMQVELFFDGTIRLTLLRVDTGHGIVGLSRGGGIPANFSESDLSTCAPCTLTKPASLTAASVSSSEIQLNWSDVGGETSYKIERRLGTGSWTQIATVGANTTSFKSSGLTGSSTYGFRVRAFGIQGHSSYSNEVSAKTKNRAPSVSLSSPTNSMIFTAPATIRVVANASDSGGTITKVGFYRNNSLFDTQKGAPYDPLETNLPVGTYAYYARAYDNEGASTKSSTVTVAVNPAPAGSLPAGWSANAVGTTNSVKNFSSEQSGKYSLTGTGTSLTFTNSVMYATYQSRSGDAQVVARLTSLQDLSSGPKAGVFMGESLEAGARQMALTMSSKKELTLFTRTVKDRASDQTIVKGLKFPIWLKIVRYGNNFSAFHSSNGQTWTLVGSEWIGLPTTANVGLLVSSGSTSNAATATYDSVAIGIPPASGTPTVSLSSSVTSGIHEAPASMVLTASASDPENSIAQVGFYEDNRLVAVDTTSPYQVSLTTLAPGSSFTARVTDKAGKVGVSVPLTGAKVIASSTGALPTGWSDQNVGSTGTGGSAYHSNGKFTIRGAGLLASASDAFRFAYMTATGNCEIIARVTSQQNILNIAKSGVMIREGTGHNAKHASLSVSPNGTFHFRYRTSKGASAKTSSGELEFAPQWLKLNRSSNLIRAYLSDDGSDWTEVASATISLASTTKLGLFVTSMVRGVSGHSTFDNVALVP
jgi:regulation of enolase protein 1 (concanavalin A-like superfamily)